MSTTKNNKKTDTNDSTHQEKGFEKPKGIEWKQTSGWEGVTLRDHLADLCHPRKKFFYAMIMNSLMLTEFDRGTMAVGLDDKGRAVLYYDNRVIATCKQKEIQRILIHEFMHIILKHIPRRMVMLARTPSDTRKRQVKAFFNVAADYAVNCMILKHGDWDRKNEETAVLKAIYPDQMDYPMHKSMDYYMHRMLREADKDPNDFLQKLLDAGLGALPVGGGKSGNGDASGMDPDEASEKIIEIFEGATPHDLWDTDPNLTPEEIEAMASKLERKLQSQVYQTISRMNKERNRGTVPAFLQSLIDDFFAGQPIPWRQVLSEFVKSGEPIEKEESFARPSRKRMIYGVFGGCTFPGQAHQPTCRVVLSVDTSGSMSDHELQLVVKEMKEFLRLGGYEIIVIEFDTIVHRVTHLESKTDINPEFKGRGGTDFNEAFKKAKDYLPDVHIIYTDGYAPLPSQANRFPENQVLWLVTPEGVPPGSGWGRNDTTDVEYGKMVRILED